jgi:hypothetical protein
MLPEPQPAMVIRYSYLWHGEYIQGREEGVKDRPCAVVAALWKDRGLSLNATPFYGDIQAWKSTWT